MKRLLPVALVAVLLSAGCQSGRPKTGSAVPAGRDPLRPYVGDVRVLLAKADEKSVTVSAKQRLSGECDMAMRVHSAGFQKGGALFSLETIGRPSVAGREPRCRNVQPAVQLLVAGLTPASSDVTARVDAVLLTPEAYLALKGVAFDRPAGEMGKDIASPDALAAAPEAVLGRKVKAWPKVLLSVSPYVHDTTGRIRQESEVEFDAVVGTDGRVHDPKLKTTLSETHQAAVLSALSRWRYEPARTPDNPVAARISSRLSLRIY
ncbi:MAG TPA: hypothetical protein VFE68_02205 [Vicinamibacteria bacterium]|nr:hypothetical protein [Vicinamibacteria bacterium]